MDLSFLLDLPLCVNLIHSLATENVEDMSISSLRMERDMCILLPEISLVQCTVREGGVK